MVKLEKDKPLPHKPTTTERGTPPDRDARPRRTCERNWADPTDTEDAPTVNDGSLPF